MIGRARSQPIRPAAAEGRAHAKTRIRPAGRLPVRPSIELRRPPTERHCLHGHPRNRPLAVRDHDGVPLLLRPLTIGLSALVAGFQTAWYRTDDERYLRLTKFFGKLFLINFAIGVVTGIVQEFQFGMNWSDYSRFVGDIFGAPLAIEGLLAFFLESTFLGLWIFGWDRLPRKLHAASIWFVAHRHDALRLLHPGRQLLHAAPRRLLVQPRHRTGRAGPTSGGADQLDPARDLPAHDHRRVPDRRGVHGRRLAVAAVRRSTPEDDRAMFRGAAKVGA